tara:strand:+ start:43 stop:279 length:237 start_codon:yes stop_codon:yes gene_type:complete
MSKVKSKSRRAKKVKARKSVNSKSAMQVNISVSGGKSLKWKLADADRQGADSIIDMDTNGVPVVYIKKDGEWTTLKIF